MTTIINSGTAPGRPHHEKQGSVPLPQDVLIAGMEQVNAIISGLSIARKREAALVAFDLSIPHYEQIYNRTLILRVLRNAIKSAVRGKYPSESFMRRLDAICIRAWRKWYDGNSLPYLKAAVVLRVAQWALRGRAPEAVGAASSIPLSWEGQYKYIQDMLSALAILDREQREEADGLGGIRCGG